VYENKKSDKNISDEFCTFSQAEKSSNHKKTIIGLIKTTNSTHPYDGAGLIGSLFFAKKNLQF